MSEALEVKSAPGASLPPEVQAESPVPGADLASSDVKAVYDMAKMGMAYGQWKPAPKMAAAYKRVREWLLERGELPR